MRVMATPVRIVSESGDNDENDREVVTTVAENDENEGDVSATGAESEENAENLGFGSRPLWLKLSFLWSGWESLLGSHRVGTGEAAGDLERLKNQSTESIQYWHGSQHVQLESSWDECWKIRRGRGSNAC